MGARSVSYPLSVANCCARACADSASDSAVSASSGRDELGPDELLVAVRDHSIVGCLRRGAGVLLIGLGRLDDSEHLPLVTRSPLSTRISLR